MGDGVVLSVGRLNWELLDLRWGRRSRMGAIKPEPTRKIEMLAFLVED
jgi:hypothetical protein